MNNDLFNQQPTVLDSWNPSVDQRAIANDLLTEVLKNSEHVTLKFTPLGAIAFARAWQEKYMESHPQTAPQEEQYLTKLDVATKLNVSLSTICNWQKRRYLVPVKVGSRCLFLKKDVDALLKQNK